MEPEAAEVSWAEARAIVAEEAQRLRPGTPRRLRLEQAMGRWLAAAAFLFYVADVSWLGGGQLHGGFWTGQGHWDLSLVLLLGPVIYAAIAWWSGKRG